MSGDDYERKSRAVKTMIEMLNAQQAREFHVMLFCYYIDTQPYSTSALTVSHDCTPNLREATNGFECDAFFRPDSLRPEEREGKEVINGVMKVKLYVNLDDLVGILATKDNGESITL